MPLPTMLSAEPSKPCGLVRLNGSKHPQRSILPAADAPGYAVRNRGSPQVGRTVTGKPSTDLPSRSGRLPAAPSNLRQPASSLRSLASICGISIDEVLFDSYYRASLLIL